MDPMMDLASSAAQSFGNLFSGIMGGQAEEARAKAYANASRQAKAEGGVNAQLALQRGDAVAAQAAVQGAANGGGFTGSTLGVIQNLSAQAMFNARTKTYQAQTEANQDLYNSKVAKANALNDFIGAGVGFFSPAIGGAFENSARQSQLQSLSVIRGTGQASSYDYMGLQ